MILTYQHGSYLSVFIVRYSVWLIMFDCIKFLSTAFSLDQLLLYKIVWQRSSQTMSSREIICTVVANAKSMYLDYCILADDEQLLQ